MLPNAKVGDFPQRAAPAGLSGFWVLSIGFWPTHRSRLRVCPHPAPKTQNPPGLGDRSRSRRSRIRFRRRPVQADLRAHGRAQQRLGPRDGAARNEVRERERVAHYRHTRILDIRAPSWRAPAPTSHYGVQTSMFPIPYRCTPAKSPSPKNPFTRPGNFPNHPQPQPNKPTSLPPAKWAPLSRPPAVLGLGRVTQLTRHLGRAAQPASVTRLCLIGVYPCSSAAKLPFPAPRNPLSRPKLALFGRKGNYC